MTWKQFVDEAYQRYKIGNTIQGYKEGSPHLSPDEMKIRIDRLKLNERRRDMMRKQEILRLMKLSYHDYLGERHRHTMTFNEYSADLMKHKKEILSINHGGNYE